MPADKKRTITVRLDPDVHAALQKWASDDLRSVSAQVERVVREAREKMGRL